MGMKLIAIQRRSVKKALTEGGEGLEGSSRKRALLASEHRGAFLRRGHLSWALKGS